MKKTLAIVTLSVMLSACASLRQPSENDADASLPSPKPTLEKVPPAAKLPAAPVAVVEDPLPAVDLSADLFYDIMRAEIGFQRGQWQGPYTILLSDAQQTRDPRLARRAAEIALAARRPAEALSAVRLWSELAPHSDEALQNYLSLVMLSDNISEIQPLLAQRLAQASPETVGPLILQIQRLLNRARDKTAAFTMLEQLTSPYSTLMESHLALAQSAFTNRDSVRAQAEANQALSIKPDSELAILTLAQVTPDPDRAMKLVADFLKKYPDAREVRIAYARGLVEQKQFEAASDQFLKLLKDNPDDQATLFALGILNVQTNHLGPAETYLKHYLELLAADQEDEHDPTQALLLLSQIAEERNDIPGALKWLEQIEPGDAYISAQIRRGQLLAKRGDINGARKVLEQAQADASNDHDQQQLILGEAQILRDAGRNQEAADILEAGVKSFPDSVDLLYDYAMAADKIGSYSTMEGALRKIIQIVPNSQHAYNALGYSLADRNIRLPEALTLIQKALELAPNDPFITDSLGWAQYRLGNFAEAEKQLRRAYGLKADPEIGVHLGEVLWVSGKQTEAKQLWRDAQAKDPQNDVLKSTLTRLNVKL
ncbi:tetratricopeptide (TPR) repeat protein [Herbaspirillum sp. Sphag1AN]|uniref:tetratricopeptide repeat protein n=1 Tax=unclassified Herbaspirillum TaxID=2624150 RepID=UPI00185010A2|nr:MULTISPECIES: tetratricopeptide repeat protein [unclassified Herbaspirillum]MBB3212823.1 tetratricopeptide (TPR) repeat protein [Herbaspirillum sp. Sphag1AN]MBB3246020.1 tetratricopeptide (TPR) repeat protein [Herbaspirillum sp. Sphag64]